MVQLAIGDFPVSSVDCFGDDSLRKIVQNSIADFELAVCFLMGDDP